MKRHLQLSADKHHSITTLNSILTHNTQTACTEVFYKRMKKELNTENYRRVLTRRLTAEYKELI